MTNNMCRGETDGEFLLVLILIMLVTLAGFGFGAMTGTKTTEQNYRKQAIEHGYASYVVDATKTSKKVKMCDLFYS